MRRRQAANDAGDGITILASPDLSDGEKKYSPRQRNRYRSFILFGVLAIIAVCLLFKRQLPTSLTAFNSIGVNVGNNNTLSHEQSSSSRIPDSAAADKNNVPAKRRASEPPRIPRRLIFTYKYNLIAPAVNDPPFNAKDPLTANVLHTIDKYRTYWDAIDAAVRPQEENTKEEVVVSFLSDNGCLEAITKAEPQLVDHFNSEKRGEFKADICRVAELYLYGGYYFDIDIGVVEPINFDALDIPTVTPSPLWQLELLKKKKFNTSTKDDIVTFSTVYNQQGRFFQAFTAAMPRHPVIKLSLKYMVGYYEGTLPHVLPQFIIDSNKIKNHNIPSREKTTGMGVGPYTLSVAHRSTIDEDWEEYAREIMKEHGYSGEHDANKEIPAKRRYSRFLYEISLEDKEVKKLGFFQDIPLQDAEYKKKSQWCNYICFGGHHIYFYSRVPGSKGCPLEKR